MATAAQKKRAEQRPGVKGGSTPPQTRRRRPGTVQRRGDDARARELWGLAALGVAIFLTFVLVVGSGGGLLGGAAAGALEIALGRFAFLVPAGLLGLAVVLLLRVRPPVPGLALGGAVLVLLSLFLLLAGGFPPFGPGHAEQEFVSAVYRERAGWAGEALHAVVSGLVGPVGVALVGWLGLLAGVSLLTGWTLGRVADRTRGAARAVSSAAATTVKRARDRSKRGPLDDPYLQGFGPSPDVSAADEESWGAWPEETLYAGPGAAPETGGQRQPPLRLITQDRRPVRLHDAATDFPDFYAGGVAETSADTQTPAHPSAAERQSWDGPEAENGPRGLDDVPAARRPDTASNEEEVASAGVAPSGSGEGAPAAGTSPGVPLVDYVLPEVELLRKSRAAVAGDARGDREIGALLVETLAHFGVEARVCGTVVGPRVTRYELQLAPGTKVNKVTNLKDDIAYALATTEIRILAPIPGKSAVGVEVPNQRPDFVTLGDIYREFPTSAGPLMVWLGKDISGKAVYTDLTKMPHLLIAGTTGSGKSGCINCIISSVLLRATPEQVRMVLIDPKKVELSHYERIPHLLVPVVTNMKSAAGVLANLVREMDERYTLMEMVKARNLDETNRARRRRGEPTLPYLLIVIDELADLMMVSPAEVEEYVIRLAQKARAVGMHLVVATQRPSADVITGMIKANIPSRIAFAVSSQTDSRVILDVNGAEALLGMGDMLFKPLGSSRLQRIQGAYITEEEIHTLVTHWRRQAEPSFREELLQSPEEAMAEEAVFDPDSDELLADAAELVLDTGNASVSMLQRRLRVGYTRAGRLIDMLERRGIVGPYEGSKPRQVLVKPVDRQRVLEELRTEVKSGRPHQLSLEEAVEEGGAE